MTKLTLIRHGQSQWNLENRFTGWWDADLTEKGEVEAATAGDLLKATGIEFQFAFTSMQTRAIRTLWLTLEHYGRVWMPVEKNWQLNERHYGGLTGLDKGETAEKHGADQVHIWRRSYDIPPPEMAADSPYHMDQDPRYTGITVPGSESLKMTLERVLPYWQSTIAPVVETQNVIIAAHGNSLRALVKHLCDVPDSDITGIEIPTGNPLVFDLDSALKPTSVSYLDSGRAKPLPPL